MMGRAQTILLVEDNADDVELTVHAFNKSPLTHDIVIARSGEEAMDYLYPQEAAPHDLPALMLLDLKLPGMSGLDVLRRVRGAESTKRLPVVILTTSDDESDIINGYNLGVNSYIRKPVDFASFSGLVDHLGLYWLKINTPSPA